MRRSRSLRRGCGSGGDEAGSCGGVVCSLVRGDVRRMLARVELVRLAQ